MSETKSKPRVRLPYRFGETVYLRGREEKVAGIVISFEATPGAVFTEVRWSDQPFTYGAHNDFELSTDYEPEF